MDSLRDTHSIKGAMVLPRRPAMGAVIVPQAIYDDAKRLGMDLTGYIRAEPMPTYNIAPQFVCEVAKPSRQQRRQTGRAARKKLGRWAKRGGK